MMMMMMMAKIMMMMMTIILLIMIIMILMMMIIVIIALKAQIEILYHLLTAPRTISLQVTHAQVATQCDWKYNARPHSSICP